jgi:hypothetical protein
MDIQTLKQELEKDLNINDAELDTESLKIPKIHNKYLNILHEEKILLQSLRLKKRIMLREKWEYYTGKVDAETLKQKGLEPFNLKVLKQDLDLYIDSDQDILQLDSKLITQQEKVDYLQDAIKAINNMQWHIRDAIAWRKFINGVN